ncbi:MAG TPA: PspC domain-containing protein [Candidatus Saccharimonadales bacterium]|nr:PspC domain-containing protein [Candidatus Saccharimonadales bacterium]
MNEIKHIHLGRQSFTISIEAYTMLHDYLDAIKTQVGKKGDVIDEIEMRMAELLEERGLHEEKVVLPEDVQFLKEQLGEPHDFKDEDEEADDAEKQTESGPKRLFRDGDRAMFAGVAAGLAAFFGVDVTIMRLIFVLLTFFGGSGIFLYILLWLIVPEAKTSSERLQMRGKAVTVDSLKEVVDRANIAGAAERVGKVGQEFGRGLGRVIEGLAKAFAALVGGVFVLAGIATFSGTMVAGSYLLGRGAKVADQVVFPIGSEAVFALFCGIVVGAIFAFFLLVAGLAMIRRKAVVKGWVLGIVTGVFLIAGGLGTVVGFDIAPQIRNKYNALHHTQTTNVSPFTNVKLNGKDVNFQIVPDATYAVEVQYFGSANKTGDIATHVDNDTLAIDTSNYRSGDTCTVFCLYSDNWLTIKIHVPTLQSAEIAGTDTSLAFGPGFQSNNLRLLVSQQSSVTLHNLALGKVTTTATQTADGRRLTLQNVVAGDAYSAVVITSDSVNLDNTDELEVTSNGPACDGSDPQIYLQQAPRQLTISGIKVEPPTRESLSRLWDQDNRNVYNCVTVL